MKSGPEATSLLGTREWTRPARPTGRPRALTSMEKRRWLCRRNRMPGDGGLGSSPPSVGEKVLGSGWASLPRGPSCRSERKRHQLPSLPLCLGGKSPSSLCPPPRPAVTVWGCGVWSAWLRARRGFGGSALTLIVPVVELVELLCELSQGLLDGLGAGHRQGEAALKVLHLIHDRPDRAAGPEAEVRRASHENKATGNGGSWPFHQALWPCPGSQG